jgi:hypothetical protein
MSLGPDEETEAVEWHQQDLRAINRVLAANGLPPHHEPVDSRPVPYRAQLISFPYSWLHYLRRAVAYARQAPEEFCPLKEGENPAKDKWVDRELYTYISSHVICHSDCEGFYVPIDFGEPLCDERDGDLPGGLLGSSQRALRELIQVAPLLGIPVDGPFLSDEVAHRIAQEPDESHPYWIERKVWLSMFEAMRLSVEYKYAVVFS